MENSVNKWIVEDEFMPIRTVNDSKARIIRYMNLSQIVQLLTSSSLYFSRIDKFEDAYEGNVIFGMDNSGQFEPWVKSCFVSSWSHFYGAEFYPMWKNFVGPFNTGVAIVNYVDTVMASINPTDKKFIKAYLTNYLPGNIAKLDKGDIISNGITKKEFYVYEQEIRLMYYSGIRNEEWDEIPGGFPVNVNLKDLIVYVIFSPFNKPWINEHIKQLFSKYELNDIEYRDSQILLRI